MFAIWYNLKLIIGFKGLDLTINYSKISTCSSF